MNIVSKNILDVEQGIIIHQVNCQNRIGSGVAGQIILKWPNVKTAYHMAFESTPKQELFGRYQPVQITPTLVVINSFTQFYYGNAAKTGRVYTDMDKLAAVITNVCEENPIKTVWIPYGIGCGLGGGDWNDLVSRIRHLPNLNVAKLD